MKPKLISFSLCPFVQRCVIALIEKKVDYDIEYIDLDNKPEWFLKISPYGRVPLLLVENDVLFESNIILEYLDEVYKPVLHPNNSVTKAKHRAWMDFCGGLIGTQYKLTTAKDKTSWEQAVLQMEQDLKLLSAQVKTPYFSGSDFHLVDVAFAPFWHRMELLNLGEFIAIPENLLQWSKHLLARPSLTKSLTKEAPKLYQEFLEKKEAYLLKLRNGV